MIHRHLLVALCGALALSACGSAAVHFQEASAPAKDNAEGQTRPAGAISANAPKRYCC
jgi:hypothetical protein